MFQQEKNFQKFSEIKI